MMQGDHKILFQMPEILLFDIFEPRCCDGMSTGGVYPSLLGGYDCAPLRKC